MFLELLVGEGEGDELYNVGPFIIYLDLDKKMYLPRVPIDFLNYVPLIRQATSRNNIAIPYHEISEIKFNYIFSLLKSSFYEYFTGRVDNIILGHLAELSTWEYIRLVRIAPFLLDNYIDEFFVDGPYSNIYLSHSRYGKMDSDISLTPNEISAIRSHLELYKGREIVPTRGTMKTELLTDSFHYRINYDMEPICIDGPSISFRNLKRGKYTIIQLIKLGTLPIEAAGFLILVSWLKGNITIIGEVGSGKTTLLNCIDMLLPSMWRKLYFEEAVESIPQRNYGKKQVHYRYELFTRETSLSKLWQVTFTLHRSPDYIILGELLTRDDVETWLFSLSSGLNGIQTIHAGSVDQFLRKLLYLYELPLDFVRDMDIIVHIKRVGESRRIVYGIYEIKVEKMKPTASPLFIFNIKKGMLEMVAPLLKSSVVKKLLSKNLIDENWFEVAYNEIINKLRVLVQRKIENLNDIIYEFNQVFKNLSYIEGMKYAGLLRNTH